MTSVTTVHGRPLTQADNTRRRTLRVINARTGYLSKIPPAERSDGSTIPHEAVDLIDTGEFIHEGKGEVSFHHGVVVEEWDDLVSKLVGVALPALVTEVLSVYAIRKQKIENSQGAYRAGKFGNPNRLAKCVNVAVDIADELIGTASVPMHAVEVGPFVFSEFVSPLDHPRQAVGCGGGGRRTEAIALVPAKWQHEFSPEPNTAVGIHLRLITLVNSVKNTSKLNCLVGEKKMTDSFIPIATP